MSDKCECYLYTTCSYCIKQLEARAEKAEAERDTYREALEAIKMPEGEYHRDELQHVKNVVNWCINTAKAALAKGEPKTGAPRRTAPPKAGLDEKP